MPQPAGDRRRLIAVFHAVDGPPETCQNYASMPNTAAAEAPDPTEKKLLQIFVDVADRRKKSPKRKARKKR
jgi:hypothetical protein